MTSQVEISKRLIFKNSICTVGTRLLSITVLVWMHQYLLQRIAVSEYAIYVVIGSIIVFVPVLFSVVTGGVARYIVEAYAKGETWRVTQIVSSMMPILGLFALAFALVGCAAAWFIDSIVTVDQDRLGDARRMMGLLVLAHATGVVLMPLTVGLYVRQKFVWINLIELGQELLRVCLLFILLLGVSPRVLWVVVAMVVSQSIGLLVTVVVSRSLVPALKFDWTTYNRDVARKLTSFGAWTLLGGVAWRLRTSADALILNELSTPAAVAAYNVGALPDRQIETMTTLASNPLQPPITAMHALGDRPGLQRAYLRGNRYYLWMVMLPGLLTAVYGVPLTRLYVGETYIAAGTVMLLLSVTYPFAYSCGMLYRVALAMARIKGFLLASVGGQLANIAITVYLVGWLGMGAVGAALGTLVVAVIMHVLVLWPMGLRMVDIAFSDFLRETLLPGLIPAASTLAACLVLSVFLPPASWLTLGASCVLGGFVYIATLLTISLRPEDQRDLRHLAVGLRQLIGTGKSKRGETNML